MNADEKSRYFQELSRNLRHEGLTVKPETEEGLLPVELDGQRLCFALDIHNVLQFLDSYTAYLQRKEEQKCE